MTNSVTTLISKAKKLAKKGSYADAKYLFEEILANYPENRTALRGSQEMAKKMDSQDHRSSNTNYFETKRRLLVELHKNGRFEELLQSCNQIDATFGGHSDINYFKGIAYAGLNQLEEAEDSFRRSIAVDPANADTYRRLGMLLRKKGNLDGAIESYNSALEINPKYGLVHFNLGNALQAKRNFESAAASFSLALQFLPNEAHIYYNIGIAFHEMGELEQAIESYKRALELNPKLAGANNNLGIAIKNMGDIAQALKCFRRALELDPFITEAHRHIANSKNFSSVDEDVTEMERLYQHPQVSETQKMHLAFGLGKAYEDVELYAKSFEFYLTGNALKRKSINYRTSDSETRVDNIIRLFSKEYFENTQDSGIADRRPIFIVGMPRSGTTLVEQILASHSKVTGAGELLYFQRSCMEHFGKSGSAKFEEKLINVKKEDLETFGRLYLKLLKKEGTKTMHTTDKLPLNFLLIGLIRISLPNAKIIHCMRDPMDTSLSIFKNFFQSEGNSYTYDLKELGAFYNLYLKIMNHWNAVIPGCIYNIQYEKLVSDQEKETRELLSFCELSWEEACMDFHQTKRKVTTASATQVRQPMYSNSVAKWKRYESELMPLYEVLNSGLAKNLIN